MAELPGKAREGAFALYDIEGNEYDPQICVFPLFVEDGANPPIFVGTGFYVTPQGVFATANHVAQNLHDVIKKTSGKPFAIVQTLDGRLLKRVLYRILQHPFTDAAVGIFQVLLDPKTREPIKNPRLIMTPDIPSVGDTVHTYAFPNTTAVRIPNEPTTLLVTEAAFYDGRIIEVYPDGRDKISFPRLSYRTNIHIHDGSSGGPVFDSLARVFAFNSRSWDDAPNDSYLTSIHEIFTIPLFRFEEIPPHNIREARADELLRDNLLITAPRWHITYTT